MRLGILTATLACLAMATAAHASRLSIVPQVGFPIPGRDIGSDQLGLSVGVSLHDMETPRLAVGVGLDVAYHYWPASAGYTAAFSRYLANVYLEELDSPTYAFHVIQFTPHVRVLVHPTKHWIPWVQGGAGAYVVEQNIGRAVWTGTVKVTGSGPPRYEFTPGWNVAVGCDAGSGAGTKLGLDVTMHKFWSDARGELGPEGKLPGFTAITTGVHAQFGW